MTTRTMITEGTRRIAAMSADEIRRAGISQIIALEARIAVIEANWALRGWFVSTYERDAYRFALDLARAGATISASANK